MTVRFLLGPAGSGKTHRCLEEIRALLRDDPGGPPLLFLAPRQATFQIERELLASPTLAGFSRLDILSWERLASRLLAENPARLLSESSRQMVLSSLLLQLQDQFEILQSSGRITALAAAVSTQLHELHTRLSPSQSLLDIAARLPSPSLAGKLRDLAKIRSAYESWLQQHGATDLDHQQSGALQHLQSPQSPCIPWTQIWLDGFAEFTPLELEILNILAARATSTTLAFCVDPKTLLTPHPQSSTNPIAETFSKCHARLAALPHVSIERISLSPPRCHRFLHAPLLAQLESEWFHPPSPTPTHTPQPTDPPPSNAPSSPPPTQLRLVHCPSIHDEADFAAQTVQEFIQSGGRYREVAVLVRSLTDYGPIFARCFRGQRIPAFLDQRVSMRHHPTVEFTRLVLRLAANGWNLPEWLALLKTGLLADDRSNPELQSLENRALREGWSDTDWSRWLASSNSHPGPLARRINSVRQSLANLDSSPNPTAQSLASEIQNLWAALELPDQMLEWDLEAARWASPTRDFDAGFHPAAFHQLSNCLSEFQQTFQLDSAPLPTWSLLLDTSFATLTVGLVPPSLDHVLIGSIERSRNPNLKIVILPGWSESQFRSTPAQGFLSEQERLEIAAYDGGKLFQTFDSFQSHSNDQLLAYIGATRASRQAVISTPDSTPAGLPDAPSLLFESLRRKWPECSDRYSPPPPSLHASPHAPSLQPEIARALYGPTLRSSVSRLEAFGWCPFRFLAESGWRLRERDVLELDRRESGSFVHLLLSMFHEHVQNLHKRWRDLSPSEAESILAQLRSQASQTHQFGLFDRTAEGRFHADRLFQIARDVILATLEWSQFNQFDPLLVEWAFGDFKNQVPPWTLSCENGLTLALRGIIDRVDLWRDPASGQPWVVLLDYKSSARRFQPAEFRAGVQIQLPAYANALNALSRSIPSLSSDHFPPKTAGFAYVALTPARSARLENRSLPPGRSRDPHRGRFNILCKPALDGSSDSSGQFSLRVKKNGEPYSNSDGLGDADFRSLLSENERLLKDTVRAVSQGESSPRPLLIQGALGCDRCLHQGSCRVESLTLQPRPAPVS